MKYRKATFLIICILLAGCAFQNMKPNDVAITGAYESSDIVRVIGAKYIGCINSPNLTLKDKLYMREKIAPVLDKAVDTQVKANRAVIEWLKTPDAATPGAVVPPEVKSKQAAYADAIAQLIAIWSQPIPKEVK